MQSNIIGKRSFNTLASVLLIIAIVFLCASTVVTSGYTVNQSDDYSHAMEVGQFHVPVIKYIGAAFGFMSRMYVNWAGNYFSMFCQSLLSPLNMGGNTQLRIVMVCNALLYTALLAALLYVFLGRIIDSDAWVKLLMIALVFYSIMNYRIYAEVFYWFSGATSYSIPLIFVFTAFILLVNSDKSLCVKRTLKSKATVMIAVSTLFLFFGAGGSLAVTGTTCFIVMIRLIYLYLQKDYYKLRITLILFSGCVVGAIINIIAPGNYARADRTSGNLGLITAAKNTAAAFYSELYWLFKNTTFFFVLILLVVIGILIEGRLKVNLRYYTLISIIGLLTPIVTIFPVVFGYNSTFMSNRTLFVIDQSVMLSIANMALVVGIWIAKYVGEASRKGVVVSFCAIALCYLVISDFGLEYYGSIHTYKGLMNGSYAKYYEEVNNIQSYFADCKGMDIVVKVEDVPVGLANFSNFYLENGWANGKIADYYGMKSLTLID